jgi:plasmid stabilization system protein ParE
VPRVLLRPRVEADALEQVGYLAAEAGIEVASRFATELEAALGLIQRHPLLGRPWATRHPGLRGVRRLVLSSFPVSIFYRPSRVAIDVIRILHHRRDLPRNLDPEN